VKQNLAHLVDVHRCVFYRVLAHLSKSNSRTFQGLSRTIRGYIRRTKLNQTGTFISIYKRHKLPQWRLGPKIDFTHIWGQKEAIWNTFFSINCFGHWILENQIQALSRTFRHRFKDFQGPCLFSRTFQALKIWKKIQGLSRTCKSPGFIWTRVYYYIINKMLVTDDRKQDDKTGPFIPPYFNSPNPKSPRVRIKSGLGLVSGVVGVGFRRFEY